MSGLRLEVTRRLTPEQMLDEALSTRIVQGMVAQLQTSMLERGLEPRSGGPQMRVEIERTPGEEHPRTWLEVLLRIPAQREPDTIRHIVTISAVGVPAPRDGDF